MQYMLFSVQKFLAVLGSKWRASGFVQLFIAKSLQN